MSSCSSVLPSSATGEDSISGAMFHCPMYAQLQERIAEHQATIDSQERKILELTTENASLRMSLVGKPTEVNVNAEKELQTKLKKCGKYHLMFYRFFVSRDMFGVMPPTTWTSTDRVRYSSPGSISAGNIAEIYECTPKAYHALFQTNVSEAVSVYIAGIGDARSSALNKVKSIRATIFPTIGAKIFSEISPTQPLSSHSAIQSLLGICRVQDKNTGHWTTQYLDDDSLLLLPVLYDDCDPSNPHSLFKNQSLIRIAKCMLASENSMWKTSTYRHIDDRPNRTMPGLIAWTGIVAILCLSDDTSFTSGTKDNFCGNVTKRPYLWCFEQFKSYLIQLANKSLFSWWDSHLFLQSAPTADTETVSIPLTPLSAQPTELNDPLANIIARLTGRSITLSTKDESESESEDFAPPMRRSVSPAIESDNAFGDDFYSPTVEADVPISVINRTPYAPPAGITHSSENIATGQPSLSGIRHSPSATEFPIVTPPEPVPAAAKGKKRNNTREKPAALQAEQTIVPACQTRRTTCRT